MGGEVGKGGEIAWAEGMVRKESDFIRCSL